MTAVEVRKSKFLTILIVKYIFKGARIKIVATGRVVVGNSNIRKS